MNATNIIMSIEKATVKSVLIAFGGCFRSTREINDKIRRGKGIY